MKKTVLCVISILMMLCFTACEIDKGVGGDQGPKASTEYADLMDLYNLSDYLYLTVINGVINEDRSIKADGEVYLPYGVVKSLDSRFYFNREEEQMIVTSPTEILYLWPDSFRHNCGEESVEDRIPLLRTFEGKLFVSSGFFLKYSDISTRVLENPSRVVLFENGIPYPSASVNKDTVIRIGASMQKDIVTEMKSGANLILTGEKQNGYCAVSTEDGMVGYVAEADLGEQKSLLLHASMKKYERTTTLDHVHMMWHQMWAKQGGDNLKTALSNTKGINVISPTWFDFKDVDGAIVSFADETYVKEAHNQGIQVWALCSDFAEDIKGYDILSRTESRNNLEDNLVNEVVRVGADGINLDFEYITKDSGPHYIQFIRELYLKCRENNLVLSVANFVPSAGKSQYRLEEQGDVVDYVIFMAYDEHYNKASGAGSVASYPWVETAVNTAVTMIPPEKIVLGIPLYNRIWMTDKDGNLTLKNDGMDTVAEQAKKGTLAWDEECKQYYSEYTDKKTNIRYQFWLEDVTSLEYKLKLITENNLAGYAGWKLGLESNDVWNLLNQY